MVGQSTFVFVGLLLFTLLSFGTSSAFIIWLNDYHRIFIDDFDFPFYDYVLDVDLPGVWFPFKDEICIDFIGTALGDGPLCQEYFRITFVFFQTPEYKAYKQHYIDIREQKELETQTTYFDWGEVPK